MLNWIKFLTVFLIALGAIVILLIFYNANKPISRAYANAEAAVLRSGDLVSVSDTAIFNGKEAYITVFGKNKDGKLAAVFVPEKQDEKEFASLLLDKGITSEEAKKIVQSELDVKEFLHVSLGIENKEYVWEIAFKSPNDKVNYVYLAFKDGVWVKRILNL